MDGVRIVAELVQVRMRRAVSGYGRRGALVEVSLDVAAGLMENRLAEYIGVTSFMGVTEAEADGGVTGEVEPGRGKGAGKRRGAPRSGGSNEVDAEPGEGTDAG